jgi:hypothetical protein
MSPAHGGVSSVAPESAGSLAGVVGVVSTEREYAKPPAFAASITAVSSLNAAADQVPPAAMNFTSSGPSGTAKGAVSVG